MPAPSSRFSTRSLARHLVHTGGHQSDRISRRCPESNRWISSESDRRTSAGPLAPTTEAGVRVSRGRTHRRLRRIATGSGRYAPGRVVPAKPRVGLRPHGYVKTRDRALYASTLEGSASDRRLSDAETRSKSTPLPRMPRRHRIATARSIGSARLPRTPLCSSRLRVRKKRNGVRQLARKAPDEAYLLACDIAGTVPRRRT